MKTKSGYAVREKECGKRECFIPFEGNGIKICRLYELGQCPEKYRQQPIAKIMTFLQQIDFERENSQFLKGYDRGRADMKLDTVEKLKDLKMKATALIPWRTDVLETMDTVIKEISALK